MRALIQRVSKASVNIDCNIYSKIEKGLLIFLGIEDTDTLDDIQWLSGKIARLRIFNDEKGIMNMSVVDVKGGLMVVSQFTLSASTKRGNRPSYIKASKSEFAVPMYEVFVKQLKTDSGIDIKTGKFGADMQVDLINDGPVTIYIDTKSKE
jgi:D-aminoacyl-tRNA deacylase